MEVVHGRSPLSEDWKKEFFKNFPLIPAVLHLVGALVIIIVGCFGEIHAGTPWWAGSLFILSGISLCMLLFRQLQLVEMYAFLSVIISIIAAAVGIILYSVEFALFGLPSNPFPHTSTGEKYDLAIRVDCAVLGLIAFQLGICIWILTILLLARKKSQSFSWFLPLHD